MDIFLFSTVKQMMASTTFLLQLQNYPKDVINNEMVELLQPYFEMEDYHMDTAKRVCGDVAGLLSWTKAMAFFHSVNREVLPLKVCFPANNLVSLLKIFLDKNCPRPFLILARFHEIRYLSYV